MARQRPPLITVGELIERLQIYEKDCEVDFSGFDLARLKMRGPKLLNIEFEQVIVRHHETGTWTVQDLE